MGYSLDTGTIFKLALSLVPIVLVIFIVWLVCYCIKNKVRIKFKSFIGKSFRPKRGDFGLFVYCGSQGSERARLIL